MARKKVDPAVAKAKKQKKQAIILSSVMLAVMAFSIPFSIKKFKALNAPPPAVAAAPVAVAPTTDGTAVPPVGTPVSAPVDAGAAAVASSAAAPELAEQPAPEPVEGQLVEFGRFEAKDPFVQQVGGYKKPATIDGTAAPSPTPKPAAGAPATGTAPPSVLPPGTTPGSLPGTTPATGTGSTPATGTPATVLSSGTITVNGGAPEVVRLDGAFPTAEPVFKLVSLTKKGAKIGVVDGNYASGDPTVSLTVGKKLTLMNTADGTRYEILLVSVA